MEQGLHDFIRAEFGHVNRRLDEHREVAAERHVEVLRRLSVLDQDECELRDGLHDATLSIAKHDRDIKTLYNRAKGELPRIRWYIACFVGGAGVILGTLKLMGKI